MHWIVVGAGSAGCAVAARLAARDDTEVTLLEAGAASLSPQAGFPSFFDALAAPGRTFDGPFVRGRGLGGSSAVNGMVGDLLPGVEDLAVPLETVGEEELGPVDRALLVGAADARPAVLTRRNGVRVTAAEAYLAGIPADRLQLVGTTEVVRVELTGARATGVELADGTVVGGDRVVLCAGALGTPIILLRSGVGDVRGLHGEGVGAGLRNHPGVPILLKRRPEVAADPHGLVTGAVLRRGDVQVLSLNHLGPLEPGWGMLLAVLLRSTSRGSVRLQPGDGTSGGGDDAVAAGDASAVDDAGAEEVVIDWALDDHDRARLAKAALVATGLAEGDAFADVVEAVEVGDSPAGVFHWSSTCAVGRVLDERGAVLGHEHLYVADASAFADLPPANLYVPTLLQAVRFAASW